MDKMKTLWPICQKLHIFKNTLFPVHSKKLHIPIAIKHELEL